MATSPGLLVHDLQSKEPSRNKPGLQEFDFVAVHGIGGNRLVTWTVRQGRKKGAMWLTDYLPDRIDGPRIMTFDYELGSHHGISSSDITDVAHKLLDELNDQYSATDVCFKYKFPGCLFPADFLST
ncbi:hypothetical protein EDB80DRAFT_176751 [Ilyonectria destructans]|nr:hypothetical protein EDB80DRAFT_176751 [Ilyonectria destructans]